MHEQASARRTREKGNRRPVLSLLIVTGVITTIILTLTVMKQQVFGYTAVKGTVLCKSGMVRKDASTTSAFAFGVTKDEIVTITDEKTGTDGKVWYQITVSNTTGYIRSDLVKKSETTTTTANTTTTTSGGTAATSSNSAAIKGSNVIVREEAATTSGIRTTLGSGQAVTIDSTVTGSDGKTWYAVSFTKAENNYKGYIRSDLVNTGGTAAAGNVAASSSTAKVLIGTVTANSIRVRKTASTTGTIMTALTKGAAVTVLETATGDDSQKWYKVSVAASAGNAAVTGYIRSDLLTVTETSVPTGTAASTGSTATATGTQIGTVKGSGVNVRKEPVTGEVVGRVSTGQSVTVTEQTKSSDGTVWYKISFTYNMTAQTGYIRSDFVDGVSITVAETTVSSNQVTASAAATAGDRNGAVKGINVNVRKEAVNGEVLCRLSTGHSITVKSEKDGADGKKWYEISYTYNNTAGTGYICADYVTVEAAVVQTGTSAAAGGTIKGTSVRIRESAVNGTVVVQLNTGHAVSILGETTGSDGYKWYQVSFTYQGSSKSGYVRSDFVNIITTAASQPVLSDADFEKVIAPLPDSYKGNLRVLHEKYPNWKFEPVNTNLDWNEAVAAECSVGKNLVSKSSISSWKSTEPQAYNWTDDSWYGFDGGSWASASKELIQYYLDPRNFFDESGIFQFETLEYQDYQNESGVSNILASSFMNGSYTDTDGATRSYAGTFTEAGSAAGISPYHIASRCLQEQGIYGTSQSVTGTVAGFENLFNFFNLGAYAANGNSATINGLIYAQGSEDAYYRPWNSRYRSIVGSAKYISEKYVKKGQNTLYFQKFNVVNSSNGIYSHQYMSNILAASAESARMKKAYSDLNTSLVFKIPYYSNMPETVCAKPTSESNPNNYLSALWIDNLAFTPQFSPVQDNYYLIVDNSVAAINIGATPVAGTSSVGGVGQVNLNVGTNIIAIVCKAQNGNTRTYTLTVQRN